MLGQGAKPIPEVLKWTLETLGSVIECPTRNISFTNALFTNERIPNKNETREKTCADRARVHGSY